MNFITKTIKCILINFQIKRLRILAEWLEHEPNGQDTIQSKRSSELAKPATRLEHDRTSRLHRIQLIHVQIQLLEYSHIPRDTRHPLFPLRLRPSQLQAAQSPIPRPELQASVHCRRRLHEKLPAFSPLGYSTGARNWWRIQLNQQLVV